MHFQSFKREAFVAAFANSGSCPGSKVIATPAKEDPKNLIGAMKPNADMRKMIRVD